MLQYIQGLFFPFLIALILATFAIIFPILIFVVLKNKKQALLQSLPLLQTSAKVLTKATASTLQFTGKVWFKKPTFCIIFEIPHDIQKCFYVNKNAYNVIFEGDEGILLFKQQNENVFFIDFHKTK